MWQCACVCLPPAHIHVAQTSTVSCIAAFKMEEAVRIAELEAARCMQAEPISSAEVAQLEELLLGIVPAPKAVVPAADRRQVRTPPSGSDTEGSSPPHLWHEERVVLGSTHLAEPAVRHRSQSEEYCQSPYGRIGSVIL